MRAGQPIAGFAQAGEQADRPLAVLGGREGAGELTAAGVDQEGHRAALLFGTAAQQRGDGLDLLEGELGHRAGNVDQLGVVRHAGLEHLLGRAANLVGVEPAAGDDGHRAVQARYLDVDWHWHIPDRPKPGLS